MVIFFILGTVVLWSVIVGTESEAAYPILYVWFFLAFARYKFKWANPDHARQCRRIEEALFQSPTNEVMTQTLHFAQSKRMFADDIYGFFLELVELDPQKSRKIFALEVGRLLYSEIQIQNDIDARC